MMERKRCTLRWQIWCGILDVDCSCHKSKEHFNAAVSSCCRVRMCLTTGGCCLWHIALLIRWGG
jgi:hypothetical protein